MQLVRIQTLNTFGESESISDSISFRTDSREKLPRAGRERQVCPLLERQGRLIRLLTYIEAQCIEVP